MENSSKYIVSVRNLKKKQGKWHADVARWHDEGDKGAFHIHTNSHGEGLWIGDYQAAGTSQFSLSGCTKSAARHRLIAWFE